MCNLQSHVPYLPVLNNIFFIAQQSLNQYHILGTRAGYPGRDSAAGETAEAGR